MSGALSQNLRSQIEIASAEVLTCYTSFEKKKKLTKKNQTLM